MHRQGGETLAGADAGRRGDSGSWSASLGLTVEEERGEWTQEDPSRTLLGGVWPDEQGLQGRTSMDLGVKE